MSTDMARGNGRAEVPPYRKTWAAYAAVVKRHYEQGRITPRQRDAYLRKLNEWYKLTREPRQ